VPQSCRIVNGEKLRKTPPFAVDVAESQKVLVFLGLEQNSFKIEEHHFFHATNARESHELINIGSFI
jgi:hypothetical protein